MRAFLLVLFIASAAAIPLEPFMVNITGGGPPTPCPVGHYNVPVGTTSIPKNAFIACNQMTSIWIPDSVVSIGDTAFQNLKALRYVNISKTTSRLKDIGEAAFQQSGLRALTIPDSVTDLHNSWNICGQCDSIETFVIGDGLKRLPYMACDSCHNLASITFGKNLKYIDGCAFRGGYNYNQKLTHLKLPKSLQEVAGEAFSSFKMLHYLWVPCNVTKLEKNAFTRTKFDHGVDVPPGLDTSGAFDPDAKIRTHNC